MFAAASMSPWQHRVRDSGRDVNGRVATDRTNPVSSPDHRSRRTAMNSPLSNGRRARTIGAKRGPSPGPSRLALVLGVIAAVAGPGTADAVHAAGFTPGDRVI